MKNLYKKYEQDRKRCGVIGKEIKKRMSVFGSNNCLQLYVQRTKLSIATAKNILSHYRTGFFYLEMSNSRDATVYTPVHLARLGILYDILGVQEDDILIFLTKKVNPRFVYSRKRLEDSLKY